MKMCIIPVLTTLVVLFPATFACSDENNDSVNDAPVLNAQEREDRASQMEPRMRTLADQFEVRTFAVGEGGSIPYRLFKPRDYDANMKYPLVVYLHGSGGRGNDNLKQFSGGNIYGARVWALPENQAKHPCFVMAPQLNIGAGRSGKISVRGEKISGGAAGSGESSAIEGKWKQTLDVRRGTDMELTLRKEDGKWSGTLSFQGETALSDVAYVNGVLEYSGEIQRMGKFTFRAEVEGDKFAGYMTATGQGTGPQVKSLIESTLEEFSIDPNRIYITGQSMGGMGTWAMIAAYPDFFAAAIPVCGRGDVSKARLIVENNVAVWAFHGAKDPTVPAEGSRSMIAALKEAGGRPRYTEYPEVKHNSWVSAYPDPRLHAWLFQQRRNL